MKILFAIISILVAAVLISAVLLIIFIVTNRDGWDNKYDNYDPQGGLTNSAEYDTTHYEDDPEVRNT
jgi:hypothetical protein